MHVITRYGGEEFVLILDDCDFQEAKEIANRIHHEISKCGYYMDDSKTKHLSNSVGYVTLHSSQQMDFDQALEIADQQMYESKHQGKNRTNGMMINYKSSLL